MKLRGQTILITGGSSGIGLALTRHLAKQNTVIICGRAQQKLDDAKKSIPGIDTFQCDIACRNQRADLFQFLKLNHPTLSVLINNAAIVHRTNFFEDEEILEKAEAEIKTNFIAPIALTKAFLSIASAPFAIINITSGLVYTPRAVYPIYNATKAALHSFTQVLRYQARNMNLQIVEVLMPAVDTPWHQGAAPKMAIPPERAVSEMIRQLEKGRTEIKVGAVNLLNRLNRLAPQVAFRVVNRIT